MNRRWWLLPLVAILLFAIVRCAWLADDAYITFRASDNLIHGYGPRWNTFERVQAFTNPLWMFVVAFFTGISGELITTVNLLQFALALGTAWLLIRNARSRVSAAIAILVLSLSRAFVDFSAAGLENGLAHLLIVAFVFSKRPFERGILASLLLMTRLDFVWLILPSLLDSPRSIRKKLVFGSIPIVLWELFSFFYYGSFVPNSARAKLGTGIPASRMIEQGAEYFFDSLRIDPLTLAAIFAAIFAATMFGRRRARLLALGLILSLGYVMFVGGDFMSGRFFTVQLVASAALICGIRMPRLHGIAAAVSALGLATLVGFPTLTDRFQSIPNVEAEVVDCRLSFHPFTGFTTGMLPAYIEYGKKLRTTRGVTVQPGIGIAGYYAGPTTKILDAFTLADPLRARMPIPDPKNEAYLKMGHFMRPIPDGYVDSMETGENVILDPSVHAYYDVVTRVTRGPLFSIDRLVDAAKLELGLYDELLAPYLSTYDEKIVHLPDLVHPPSLDLKCYTWWRACAERGIAFTETGARIELGLQLRPSRVHFDVTPDEYQVIFRVGGKETRRATLGKGESDVEVNDVFDAVVLLPRTPGRRVLLGFGAAP